MRMMHEIDTDDYCGFITLTYDNENLPFTAKKPDGILVPTDLQGFWKRLRINLKRAGKDTKIRFYACGEYGDENNRPHYHAICWGVHPANDRKLVHDSWGKGRTSLDLAEADSIQYVAGYVAKKLGFNNAEHRQGYPRPFQVASNGIGLDWLKKNWTEVLYEAALSFRGRKIPVPRYYREKLGKYWPDAYAGMEQRLLDQKLVADADLLLKIIPEFGGRSWEQLSPLERVTAHNALVRAGRLYNAELKSREDIKLAGLAAKAKNIADRRRQRL